MPRFSVHRCSSEPLPCTPQPDSWQKHRGRNIHAPAHISAPVFLPAIASGPTRGKAGYRPPVSGIRGPLPATRASLKLRPTTITPRLLHPQPAQAESGLYPHFPPSRKADHASVMTRSLCILPPQHFRSRALPRRGYASQRRVGRRMRPTLELPAVPRSYTEGVAQTRAGPAVCEHRPPLRMPSVRNAFGVGWNERQYSRVGLAANPSLCCGIPSG